MKYSTIVLNKMSSSSFLELYMLSYMLNKNEGVYGKEILDYIKSFDIAWKPSHGTLYPIIKDMVEKGLIELYSEKYNKKVYIITPKGKEYYEEKAKDFKKMLLDSSNFYTKIAEGLFI